MLSSGKLEIPRYAEAIKPQKEETRTEEEVKEYMIGKLRAIGAR